MGKEEEEQQQKALVSRRKEIIKIRAEINKKEMKVRLIKLKAGSLRRQAKLANLSSDSSKKKKE